MGIVTVRNSDHRRNCRLDIYKALSHIQHTGQKYVGMSCLNGNKFYFDDKNGTVKDFVPKAEVEGYVGSGSVCHIKDTQPYVGSSPGQGEFSLAFDGFISNRKELKDKIGGVFHTPYDAELASKIIFDGNDVVEGMARLSEEIKGPYCISLITEDGSTYVARDPMGMRAFVSAKGDGKIAASTSSRGLSKIGLELYRDILPGEIAQITDYDLNNLETVPAKKGVGRKLCSFLFGYWEYEDCFVDGISVTIPKKEIARWLAERDIESGLINKIDGVVPIPGSGIPYGEYYAIFVGKPLIHGIMKYTHAQRSYPQGTLQERESEAEDKLSVLESKVEGLRLLVMDDSIRKGTQIRKGPITMLKEAGVEEIYLRIASPRNTKYCRFDNPPGYADSELLANRYLTDEAMAEHLGVNSVRFIELEPFLNAIAKDNKIKIDELCTGCYIGGDSSFLDI
jgi:amidophosphoribosyltransferase